MTIHQCNLSVSIEDVRQLYRRHFPGVAAALEGTLLAGLTAPDVAFGQGTVSLSAKKRVPLLGELTAAVRVRPSAAADGHTLRLTLEKIVAGPLETGTLANLVMSRIGTAIAAIPGCRVDGNALLVDLAALTAAKGVELGGCVTAVDMLPDAIAISVA